MDTGNRPMAAKRGMIKGWVKWGKDFKKYKLSAIK